VFTVNYSSGALFHWQRAVWRSSSGRRQLSCSRMEHNATDSANRTCVIRSRHSHGRMYVRPWSRANNKGFWQLSVTLHTERRRGWYDEDLVRVRLAVEKTRVKKSLTCIADPRWILAAAKRRQITHSAYWRTDLVGPAVRIYAKQDRSGKHFRSASFTRAPYFRNVLAYYIITAHAWIVLAASRGRGAADRKLSRSNRHSHNCRSFQNMLSSCVSIFKLFGNPNKDI